MESFVHFYSPDVKVFRQGEDVPFIMGIDNLREVYKNLFNSSPNLDARILERRVEGPYIIDRESIKGFKGNTEPDVFSVRYRLEGNKIIEVELIKL